MDNKIIMARARLLWILVGIAAWGGETRAVTSSGLCCNGSYLGNSLLSRWHWEGRQGGLGSFMMWALSRWIHPEPVIVTIDISYGGSLS